MDVSSPGRREENKQCTRSALEQAAARLFEQRGFEATTVRDIAAAEGLLTALCEAIVDWLGETGAAPSILVSGPPKSGHQEAAEAHALMNDLENAVTDAFLDRLEAVGADRRARSTVLRAAVQARRGVGAARHDHGVSGRERPRGRVRPGPVDAGRTGADADDRGDLGSGP